MGSILGEQFANNPVKIQSLTKEQLIDLNDRTEAMLEELEAQRVIVREEILHKIAGDAEIIGNRSFTRIKIFNFDVDLDQAKQLGATKVIPAKEAIDTSKLKRLLQSGAKIKHEIVERLMIREVKHAE